MYSEHTTPDLAGNIYDAVNDETLWPIFLERLAGTLRNAATNVFVQDLRHPGGAASTTFGTDLSFICLLRQSKYISDPWQTAESARARGK